MLEGFTLAAAEAYNDQACLELLQLLKRAYEFAAYVLAGDEITKWQPYEQERRAKDLAEEKFRERIKVYYRALPKPKKDIDLLVDSKLWIIKEVSNQWGREVTLQNSAAFHFLCEAYDLSCFSEEKQGILQVIHERTGAWFQPEYLEGWLKEPNVPDEIRQRLVAALARNGGPKLADHYIRCADFLKTFKLEERSPVALKAVEEFLTTCAEFERKTIEFMKSMQAGWGLNGEKIGQSEYVLGKISFEFDKSLSWLKFKVELPADCSKELGQDVFGRARRHIKRWTAEIDQKLEVFLLVTGGIGNLGLPHNFGKED